MDENIHNDFVVALGGGATATQEHQQKKRKRRAPLLIFIILILLLGGSTATLFFAPRDFTPNTLVDIPDGFGLSQIARILEENKVIRSPLVLKLVTRWTGDENSIPAGGYLFRTAPSVFDVARRLTGGAHGVERLRVTIPEGMTVLQMADIFVKIMPAVDRKEFLSLTKNSEGYLFPDTYFFFSTATSGPIVEALRENFLKKTEDLRKEAQAQQKKWEDVVTMASLIEEEAITEEDRRIISGILWKRLTLGMPLQVDAVFGYIKGKALPVTTLDDLEIDSPYNTYKNRGLPPTPITNPGLDALEAALHPVKSEYLYYLSDKNGLMHYAKTFEEHKVNKEKYLR